MKEIKEFIQELYDSATSGYTGMLVPLDAATRIVAAGMNFQDHEIKSKHKFRRFEKSDINKVADFKYIPNPANGGDGTEPFCNVKTSIEAYKTSLHLYRYTASFKGCHSGKLGEFNGHRTVPVDINNRYKKATSNGMDCSRCR